MITLEARVIKGIIPKSIESGMADFFAGNDDKWVRVTLSTIKSQRSLPQNAYYHSAVVPIIKQALKELGYQLTNQETHEFLKDKFVEAEPMTTSEGVLIGYKEKHTSTLSKTQFMEYIANIQQFAAEILGVVIPDPNEQTTIGI